MAIKSKFIVYLVIPIILSSCKKYLDYPSDKKLTIISSLTDMQSLLDQYYIINERDPNPLVYANDDLFLDFDIWESLIEFDRGVYVWEPYNIVRPYSYTGSGNAWSDSYNKVYQANIVLDNIASVERTENNYNQWNDIIGQAYFIRGKTFLNVAWIWALSFDSASFGSDLGIPLRLNSNFNEVSKRANIRDTYSQIIDDLKAAANYLPLKVASPFRPSKGAAYGFLARTYLSMNDFINAEKYSDSALQISSALIDFNSDIDLSETYPFAENNKEVIYFSKIQSSRAISASNVNTMLYHSYDSNDLRKSFYFNFRNEGHWSFKGNYTKSSSPFSGMSTNEILLISMEANARNGNIGKAVSQLNDFMITRWKEGTYVPFSSADMKTVVDKILIERRKELLYRGIRWSDLKRLNKLDANVTQKRELNGVEYILAPNDLRYAMAIPEDVIERSSIIQNPR